MAKRNFDLSGFPLGVGIVAATILILVFRKDVKGVVENIHGNVVEKDIKKELGVDDATYKACEAIADNIYHAFHDDIDEDEETAVNNLAGAKTSYQVKTVCRIYQEKYSKSLKSDFNKYVHWPDTAGIKSIATQNWF